MKIHNYIAALPCAYQIWSAKVVQYPIWLPLAYKCHRHQTRLFSTIWQVSCLFRGGGGGEFHQPASLTSMSRNDTIRNITISRFQNSPCKISLTSIKHCYSNSNGFRTSMKSCNIILAEISVPGACPQAVCHHGNSSVAVLPSARNQRPHKVIFRPCTYCQRTLPAIYYTWPNEPWVPSAKRFESSPSKFHKNMFCSDMKNKDQIMLQFCTCHDSSAVMACAKSWHDCITIIKIRAKFFFARFQLWACILLVKWAGWLIQEYWRVLPIQKSQFIRKEFSMVAKGKIFPSK